MKFHQQCQLLALFCVVGMTPHSLWAQQQKLEKKMKESAIAIEQEQVLNDAQIKRLDQISKEIAKETNKNGKNPFEILRKKIEGQKIIVESGTNIGGTLSSLEQEMQWCRNKVVYLEDVRKRSILLVSQTSNFNLASKKIIDGMMAALNDYDSKKMGVSFTKKSLERGILIASILGVPDPSHNDISARDAYFLLDSYLSFVIETVAKKLDIDVFIPFAINPKSVDVKNLEKIFVDYAREQLHWNYSSLTRVGETANGVEPFPVGNPKNFFQVSEVITLSTTHDLLSSLWKYRFSCSIEKLFRLHNQVKNYNLGDSSDLINDRMAVYLVRDQLIEVEKELSKKDSCY